MLGTTSDDGKCPTLYGFATVDIVVQGYAVTDPEEVTQLQNVPGGGSLVRVPRALSARSALKE
jgi:hypothetical protein